MQFMFCFLFELQAVSTPRGNKNDCETSMTWTVDFAGKPPYIRK